MNKLKDLFLLLSFGHDSFISSMRWDNTCFPIPESIRSGSSCSGFIGSTQAEEKIKIKFLSLSADDNRNNIREKYIKVNAPKEFPNVEIEYDLGGGGQDYAKTEGLQCSGDMPDIGSPSRIFHLL